MKIEKLKVMLRAEAKAADWWDKMSPEEKQAYIKAHPKSKYAKSGGVSAPAAPAAKAPVPKAPKAPNVTKKDPKEPVVAPKPPKARRPKVEKPPAGKEDRGFYPKDSWKPKRQKPSLKDTLGEMFGLKRATYASLSPVERLVGTIRAETAAVKMFASLNPVECRAYLLANPRSRFAAVAGGTGNLKNFLDHYDNPEEGFFAWLQDQCGMDDDEAQELSHALVQYKARGTGFLRLIKTAVRRSGFDADSVSKLLSQYE